MFQPLNLLDSVMLGALVGLVVFAFNQEKRMKAQDRQFRMLLARLNQLTGREVDDFSSPIDED